MKTKFKFSCFIIAFLIVACDMTDANIDPGNLKDASLPLILPGMEIQAANNIGLLGGRMPGIVMQHWAGSDAQQLAYTSYNITEADLNALWVGGLYQGVMKDAKIVIDKATVEGNPYYIGIAKILMAHALGLTTSFWGDIPYSKALDIDQFPKPTYDSQQDIYIAIQNLLSEAIVELSKPAYTAPKPPTVEDIYFGGNATKWVKTARALKARYFIHLTKRDPANAQKALNEILTGGLTSNADDALCPYRTNQNNANPYYLFGVQRPSTMVIAPSFVATVTATNDPRKNKIVHTNNTSYFNSGNTNLFWVQANSALPLISYAEQKFIESEARLLTGDQAGSQAALTAAIQANMSRYGVDGSTYIISRGNFIGLTTDAQRLQRIIEEKYVSGYAQAAAETWVDYRRTGYPNLTPIPNGTASGLNPGGLIPRRFIYPISERTTNEENNTAAKTAQSGGLMNVDLWAFKN